MRTSLSEFRRSKTSRFISIILLVNFLASQNLYAQEYHVREGIHLYTPVLEIGGERLPSGEDREAKIGEPPLNTELPIENFLENNPLFSPTAEIGHFETPLVPTTSGSGDSSQDIVSPAPLQEEPKGNSLAPLSAADDYEYETYSFDQALDLIRPEFAVAIPIESITEEELEILRRLDIEIAFVSVKGIKFLLTSGHVNEIRTHGGVRRLLEEASFLAHTHPHETESHGPSSLDLLTASSRKEYLLTSDEILSYTKEGIQERLISSKEFLKAWELATQTIFLNEYEARWWANRFIQEMDRLNREADLVRENLRASGTVAPDPTLTAANLTNFSGSPWTLLMTGSSTNTSIVQQSNTQFQINYDITTTGSASGAYASFDNPTTSTVEVGNLSTLTNFVVGVKGPADSKLRFRVEDSLGAVAEVDLINLSTSMQFYKISKTLLAGIDWTKVKRFIYSIDSTRTSTLTGTLTIQTKTLLYSSTAATNLPNLPSLTLAPGSSFETAIVTSSSSQFKLNYNLSSAGSVSGASIVLDNPSTTAVETGNLSALNEFTFGFSGPAVSVKIEAEDAAGVKSWVVVSGVAGTMQYFTVQKGQFTGGSPNWSQIKRFNIYVQLVTGSPLKGTLVAHARTLTYSTALLTNLPNSPYLAILPGSSAPTTLIETSSAGFKLNYDVSQTGSISGGSIVLDNPSTTTVEVENLLFPKGESVGTAAVSASSDVSLRSAALSGGEAISGLRSPLFSLPHGHFGEDPHLFEPLDLTTLKPVGFEESLEMLLPSSYSLDTLKTSFGDLSFLAEVLAAVLKAVPALSTFQLSTLPLNLLTDAFEADILKNIEKPVLLSELKDQNLTSLREAFPDPNPSSLPEPLPLFFDSESIRLPIQTISTVPLVQAERPTFALAPSPHSDTTPSSADIGPAKELENESFRVPAPFVTDALSSRRGKNQLKGTRNRNDRISLPRKSRSKTSKALPFFTKPLSFSRPEPSFSISQWWEDLLSAQKLTKDEESVHEGRLLWQIHKAEKTSSVFRMKNLTDFDWNRLYIFPSQTTNEQMSKEIGFKWAGLSPDDQKNEELCFLIFVKDRKAVQFFKYHKFYGDFSQAYQEGGYLSEEAVFTAQKSSQLLHGEFPPLVVKAAGQSRT